MTHRAEQVLDAVASLVRARVEASGVKVYTHRRLTLDPEQDDLPAISIDYGEDRRAESQYVDQIDSVLEVQCTAVVVDPEEKPLRQKLLELRREIHQAVMADTRLGLEFVVTTAYGGASAPAVEADGEQLVGELQSTWLVAYSTSTTDPGN